MGGATQLLCIIAADNRHSLAGDSLRGPDEGVLAVGQAGPILPVRSRDTRCCLPGHVTVATPGLVLKRGPVKKPQRALQKLVRVYHPKPFPDLPCLLCFSCRCFAPAPWPVHSAILVSLLKLVQSSRAQWHGSLVSQPEILCSNPPRTVKRSFLVVVLVKAWFVPPWYPEPDSCDARREDLKTS